MWRERRAILARLSLCLLLAFLGAASLASAAHGAELAPPFLQETNPASPGASLTLRIRGQEEEVQTKVVIPRTQALTGGMVVRGLEPTNTVKIYEEAGCKGSVVAEGTMADLEGVGILVTVVEESTTVFYATQSNAGETSLCS